MLPFGMPLCLGLPSLPLHSRATGYFDFLHACSVLIGISFPFPSRPRPFYRKADWLMMGDQEEWQWWEEERRGRERNPHLGEVQRVSLRGRSFVNPEGKRRSLPEGNTVTFVGPRFVSSTGGLWDLPALLGSSWNFGGWLTWSSSTCKGVLVLCFMDYSSTD